MAQSTTLSSAGVSGTVPLNPVAKATTLQLTVNSSGSAVAVFDIQATLDDPTITPAPTLVWAVISSAAAMAEGAGIFDVGGLVYSVVTPIGGVRLHSTTSSSVAQLVTATLKALQSVTA